MIDINVYGPIGEAWSGDAVKASDFARALADAGGDDVTIHINSGGGDVFDANAMAESLRAYKGRSVASIEGLAASAASYFALTADEVVINPSALVMIHNPSSVVFGEAGDMRKTAEVLDKVKETIVSQYARKTGQTSDEIAALMDAETWLTADEAVEMGLADRKTDSEPVAACVDARSLKAFRNAPAALLGKPADGTGDTCKSIRHDSTKPEPEAGAAEGVEEASTRTECVNGAFLKAKANA